VSAGARELAPSDASRASSKRPADFTDEQKAAINKEIVTLSEGLQGKNFGSHQAAAQALHNSELPAFFDSHGIEGWAVIDESGVIKSVGTGFHGSEARGVFLGGSRGAWVSGKSYVWHTHPSGGNIHFGDVNSGVLSGALGIYASGDSLSFAALTLDVDVIGSTRFTVSGFDSAARTINSFRNYSGRVDWTLNVFGADGSVTSTPKANIRYTR